MRKNIIQCDVCGREMGADLFPWKAKVKIKKSSCFMNEWKKIDICEVCQRNFLEWLEENRHE